MECDNVLINVLKYIVFETSFTLSRRPDASDAESAHRSDSALKIRDKAANERPCAAAV